MMKKMLLFLALCFIETMALCSYSNSRQEDKALEEKYWKIDLKTAQEMLAKGDKISRHILFFKSMQMHPDLVLFYIGVAGIKPSSGNLRNVLMFYIDCIADWRREKGTIAEMQPLVQNLVYMGVPTEVVFNDGTKLVCETILKKKMERPEAPNFPNTTEGFFEKFAFNSYVDSEKHKEDMSNANRFLYAIKGAQTEVQKARESVISNIETETGLGKNCTSIVLSYAYENYHTEHVIPESIREKIAAMQWDQDVLREKYEKNSKKTAFLRFFGGCCNVPDED